MDAATLAAGKQTFRFDTYGNETFWTDTLRMHEVIATSVSPITALGVGLKVDVDALPPFAQQLVAAQTAEVQQLQTILDRL